MKRRFLFLLLASSALVPPQAALADGCRFETFANGLRRSLGANVLRGVGYGAITAAALLAVGVTGAPMVVFVGITALRGFAPGLRRLATDLGDQLDTQMGAFDVQYQ